MGPAVRSVRPLPPIALRAFHSHLYSTSAHPTLEFILIVNPNNGPGSEPWWPNADYVREIPRLNAQPNVRIVGYVFTAYCKRPNEEVCADIAKYAEWSKDGKYQGLGVAGIFFDETPNLFSDEAKTYLDVITQRVKDSEGILGDRIVSRTVLT